MKHRTILFFFLLPLLLPACRMQDGRSGSPRIVNIINFIRLTEPRSEEITDRVLFETVLAQAEDLRSKNLIGTYLLQYDALIDPSYQELMKEEMARGCEVGAWWEITQPHVEAAGYSWRGRYPWDWHAHVGFSVGYTQAERERLADVYMEKFKEIFGMYPKSVGSWFIEAGTLAYLRDKYGIEASCSCRDQVGTDGYTLWGGYWNGGYYPSRQNAYMPAQTAEGAIDVPVFRMLGSDPIYQYEAGVGGAVQSVITLEPVYELGGGLPQWVDWFFRMFTAEPHLGYNYVQVGQENSFTWEAMEKGFRYQTECLVKLCEEGKVRIETLGQTGRWFREHYPVTPPTSVVTTEDFQGNGRKTLWFNSRYYRANLLWEGRSLKIRDLHLFDESLRSQYLDQPDTLPVFHYETLPLVDGCLWSTADRMAGLHLVAPAFEGGEPAFRSLYGETQQEVVWPSVKGRARFELSFTEGGMEMAGIGKVGDWYLELDVAPGSELPFGIISGKAIHAFRQGMDYGMKVVKGTVEDLRSEGGGSVFRLFPEDGKIVMEPFRSVPYAVAHRGCWLMDGKEFYINENCPAGVWMAARYGYPAIECDVKYTRDSVMVIMHDNTINRTMRNAADYSPIPEPVKVSDCTFEELRSRYVLASTDPALRTPIPTLREELEACRDAGIVPMLHSAVVESYELAHEMLGDGFIAFDADEAAVSHARDYSSCLILLDPGKDDASGTVRRLEQIGGRCGMSTMNYRMLDAAYIRSVKEAGFAVQASIFPAPHEQRALGDGVTLELSDFFWYQGSGRQPVTSLNRQDLVLGEGETFEWTAEAPVFAGVTMDLVFSGSLEITFCGRKYVLDHADAKKPERFGVRLYKADPSLTLRALSPSSIYSLQLSLYDCSVGQK